VTGLQPAHTPDDCGIFEREPILSMTQTEVWSAAGQRCSDASVGNSYSPVTMMLEIFCSRSIALKDATSPAIIC